MPYKESRLAKCKMLHSVSMKLNPQDQFNTNENTIMTALEQYTFSLIAFEAAKSGIENTTILVDTDKGRFVLRVYRQNKKTDRAIKEEIRFIHYLAQNNLPVPIVQPNTNHQHLTHVSVDNLRWQLVLMEYMPGTHAPHYSIPLIKNMARTQAKLHLLSEKYDYDASDLTKLTVLRETGIIKQIVKESLNNRLIGFIERAEQYKVAVSLELPSGVCHLDYSKGNILVDNDSNVSALLDFDDMEVAPYVICLGFALYHLRHDGCSQVEQEEYLNQYKATRKLSEAEAALLPSIELFRHYFISSLHIFHQHRSEADIINYLDIENDLLRQVQMANSEGNNTHLS